MRNPMLVQRPGSRCVLGLVSVAAVLSAGLAAAGPAPWVWLPARPVPVPPRGPFVRPPRIPMPGPIPSPYPNPYLVPPRLPQFGNAGSTDRNLVVVPPTYDPQFSKPQGAGIDPGIVAAPRVQGLPIMTPGWRPGRR
jgi:hypothetical protein